MSSSSSSSSSSSCSITSNSTTSNADSGCSAAPSVHSPNRDSIEGKSWYAAAEGNLEQVKSVVQQAGFGQPKQFCLDMALMGATFNTNADERKKIKNWSWKEGACILWDIQQKQEWIRESRDNNSKLKRLGGPGEVTKGEFKGIGAAQ